MASYTDLHTESGTNLLLNRVAIAVTIAADTIVNELNTTANHAARLVWASSAFTDPQGQSKRFLNAILAANKDATVAAIQGSTDIQIQANVDAVVDVFAGV